jgi:hypothetical protein
MNSTCEIGEISELTFRQLKQLSTQKTSTSASMDSAYDFLEVVKQFSLSY